MFYWNIWDGPIFSSALASLGLSLVDTEQEELHDLGSGIFPSLMLAQLPWLWDGPLTCLQVKNNFPQPSAFRTNVEDREVTEGGMSVLALSDTFTVALPSQWIHTFLPDGLPLQHIQWSESGSESVNLVLWTCRYKSLRCNCEVLNLPVSRGCLCL